MEKAIWNGKEIIASEIALRFDLERDVRKASGRKELLCPDKNCTHRVLRYCHGEKKDAYFAHINNSDCDYERYDKATSDITKDIKRKLYFLFLQKGYDVSLDEKIIARHYTHLVLRYQNEIYAIQIITRFSSANRIDDFFEKYRSAAIPVLWVVTDDGRHQNIDESEMQYAKRFSINTTADNSILSIDLKGETITLYRMDTNEYLYNGISVGSENYPKIFHRTYPLTDLVFSNGRLTVLDFEHRFDVFVNKKLSAFEKYKETRLEQEKKALEAAENRRKAIEAQRKREEQARLEKLRKAQEIEKKRRWEEEQAQKEMERQAAEKKAKRREELKPLNLGYQIGDIVEHSSFGRGKIMDLEGNRATILFERKGKRQLSIRAEQDKLRKVE